MKTKMEAKAILIILRTMIIKITVVAKTTPARIIFKTKSDNFFYDNLK